MNLIIDIGNTLTKVAIFNGSELVIKRVLESEKPQSINSLVHDYPDLKKGIVSTVKKRVDFKLSGVELLYLSHQTKVPFENKYKTPATLGLDRVSLISAAYYEYPSTPCLVIDAGTCITYDFMEANGDYLGGGISPGVKMRLKAMHDYTAKLPDLEIEDWQDLVGRSTKESMLSGAVNGARSEMRDTIHRYQERYPNLVTVLTGGDVDLFAGLLKSGIFAAPNFLVKGLNYILEHNA